MTDVLRRAGETSPGASSQPDSFRVFEQIERAIAVGIGVFLIVAAVLALASAAALAWDGVVQWPQIRSLFGIVDRLLLVLMVIEILHTVRASVQSHELAVEPFLTVGMIATVRRILVVTLETSDRGIANQAAAGPSLTFDQAMIELGVLAVLTLVLAIAIHLSRRSKG
jgi:uncharacterized membrane protein (DUF373 family)